MESMPLSTRRGLFTVESFQYKEHCLPYPRSILQLVNKHLASIANEKNEAFLKIIRVLRLLCFLFSIISYLIEPISYSILFGSFRFVQAYYIKILNNLNTLMIFRNASFFSFAIDAKCLLTSCKILLG